MSEKSTKRKVSEDIEAIAERAEHGEDVSAYFTNRHVAKQRVNIDLPLELLRQIDTECQRVGVTRQREQHIGAGGNQVPPKLDVLDNPARHVANGRVQPRRLIDPVMRRAQRARALRCSPAAAARLAGSRAR